MVPVFLGSWARPARRTCRILSKSYAALAKVAICLGFSTSPLPGRSSRRSFRPCTPPCTPRPRRSRTTSWCGSSPASPTRRQALVRASHGHGAQRRRLSALRHLRAHSRSGRDGIRIRQRRRVRRARCSLSSRGSAGSASAYFGGGRHAAFGRRASHALGLAHSYLLGLLGRAHRGLRRCWRRCWRRRGARADQFSRRCCGLAMAFAPRAAAFVSRLPLIISKRSLTTAGGLSQPQRRLRRIRHLSEVPIGRSVDENVNETSWHRRRYWRLERPSSGAPLGPGGAVIPQGVPSSVSRARVKCRVFVDFDGAIAPVDTTDLLSRAFRRSGMA